MKIQGQKYEFMKSAVKAVVEAVGPDHVRAALALKKVSPAWEIWNRASDDLRYDDTHPVFKVRQRVVPYNPTFNVYSDDTHDGHIQTALFHILKELLDQPQTSSRR